MNFLIIGETKFIGKAIAERAKNTVIPLHYLIAAKQIKIAHTMSFVATLIKSPIIKLNFASSIPMS